MLFADPKHLPTVLDGTVEIAVATLGQCAGVEQVGAHVGRLTALGLQCCQTHRDPPQAHPRRAHAIRLQAAQPGCRLGDDLVVVTGDAHGERVVEPRLRVLEATGCMLGLRESQRRLGAHRHVLESFGQLCRLLGLGEVLFHSTEHPLHHGFVESRPYRCDGLGLGLGDRRQLETQRGRIEARAQIGQLTHRFGGPHHGVRIRVGEFLSHRR